MKEPNTHTWEKPGVQPERISLEEIATTIAIRHGLEVKVSSAYSQVDYQVVVQTDESDFNLLTRLASGVGAVAKPANGCLLLVPANDEPQTAGGQPIEPVTIFRHQVSSWSVNITKRGLYKSVKTHYRDMDSAQQVEVVAGKGEPCYTIRQEYCDERLAMSAAHAQLAAFKRGAPTCSLTMPGDPRLMAQTPLKLSGFREGVGGDWIIESVTHTLNNQGYTSSVEGSFRLPEDSGEEQTDAE